MDKLELIILVGPPCSGKSTLSFDLTTHKEDKHIIGQRISQDDQTKQGHLVLFNHAIDNNYPIIVIDRMNFDKAQRKRYLDPAKAAGYDTKIIVLHENKETCLTRGKKRLLLNNHPTIKTEQDLHKAINFFFSHYERPTLDEADEVEYRYPELSMKLNAIVFDIDGTMAKIDHRLQYVQNGKKDWKSFLHPQNVEQDTLNVWCRDITNSLRSNHIIVGCSGRPDNLRKTTEEWLQKNQVYYDYLFMRPRDDRRQDSVIKEIILDFEMKTRFNVKFVIDDRDQVVKKWRERDIVCLQCAPGDF